MTTLDKQKNERNKLDKLDQHNNDQADAFAMQLFWRHSRAGQAFIFSLFAGFMGVNLFADLALGLNILCFALLVIVGFVVMRYVTQSTTPKTTILSKTEIGLLLLALFFVATFVWRDSIVLNSLSVISLLLLGIVAFSLHQQRHWNTWTLRESGTDSLAAARYVATTPFALGRHSSQETLSLLQRFCDRQTSEAVVRGLLIAMPILVIFLLLLTKADARFQSSVTNLLDWDLSSLWNHAGLFILCFMLAAMLQRAAGVLTTASSNKSSNKKESESSSTASNIAAKNYRIETGIVLALVNVLFLSFVWVQFSYFFGGDALVQEATGPSYSEYARRGFFQLLAVALLVMLLLLSSYALFKPITTRQQRWFQVLAGSVVVLTWIIELSAIHRMFIYVQAYGLTELRFYSSVMMLWVACMLLWFSLSVLRNRAGMFLFGAIISLFISVAALHIVNPDATIMRTNMDRLAAGKQLDPHYIEHLSADAIPVVAKRLPLLHQNNAHKPLTCRLSSSLLTLTNKTTSVTDKHWLAWHWARYQRDQAMAIYQPPKCW